MITRLVTVLVGLVAAVTTMLVLAAGAAASDPGDDTGSGQGSEEEYDDSLTNGERAELAEQHGFKMLSKEWWKECKRLANSGQLPIWCVVDGPEANFGGSMDIKPSQKLGQTPPALAWIYVEDSRGTNAWNYELSLDRGGVSSPTKWLWSVFTDLAWLAYKSMVMLGIWFIDWTISFEWLTWVAAPFQSIGGAFQGLVDHLGLAPTFAMFTALVGGFAILAGKTGSGVWEIAMTAVIAALATGILASPVDLVAGPDGFLMDARDFGLEASSALTSPDGQPSDNPEEMRQEMTGQLVDIFIRTPQQLINFGEVIDGSKCQKTYNDVVDSGPYGDEDDIRETVDDCDNSAGEYAESPSAGMAWSAMVAIPAGLLLLVFLAVVAGGVLYAVLNCLWQSVLACWTMVKGLLPGANHTSFFLTLSEVAVSLGALVLSLVGLGGFLIVVIGVFGLAAAEGHIMKAFFLVDVLLLVGIILFRRIRTRLKESAARLAARLAATRPQGGPGQLPRPGNHAAAAAATAAVAARTVRRGATVADRSRRLAYGAGYRTGQVLQRVRPPAPGETRTTPGGAKPDPAAGPSTSSSTPPGDPTMRSRTGRAATAALALATGGTTTAITRLAAAKRAAGALQAHYDSARRTALQARLNQHRGPSRQGNPIPLGTGAHAGGGYERVVRDGQVVLVPRASAG